MSLYVYMEWIKKKRWLIEKIINLEDYVEFLVFM